VFGDEPNRGDFALVRLRADGNLDASFGSGGKVTTDFFGKFDGVQAVAILSDGRIVAAGEASNDNITSDFALARYNADGSLDATFGSDGRVTTAISDCGPGGNSQDRLFAIAIQMDGKMVAGGFTVFCGPFAFALARYNVDGSLDPAFGLEGKITTAFSGECILRAIALQPNGKIVAAGYASCCSFTEFALARYKTDGSLDSTFGTGGKVTTSFLDGSGEAHGIALQADGKIIAAGRALDFNTFGFKFALSRYMGDPSFDLCLQDDSNGNLLQFNSTTGDYLFTDCRKGITLRGTGAVTNDPYGCKITLQDAGPNTKRPDRSVLVQVNRCTHAARASIQIFSTGSSFSITDSDITNNTCACR
jgi:uncharacterized delta-60 repeat protein